MNRVDVPAYLAVILTVLAARFKDEHFYRCAYWTCALHLGYTVLAVEEVSIRYCDDFRLNW